MPDLLETLPLQKTSVLVGFAVFEPILRIQNISLCRLWQIRRFRKLKAFQNSADNRLRKILCDIVDCLGLTVEVNLILIDLVLSAKNKTGVLKQDFLIDLIGERDFRGDDDAIILRAAIVVESNRD